MMTSANRRDEQILQRSCRLRGARKTKQVFNLPLAIGFGVKSKKDVQSLSKIADIVIAGSVFVSALKGNERFSSSLIEKKIRELRV